MDDLLEQLYLGNYIPGERAPVPPGRQRAWRQYAAASEGFLARLRQISPELAQECSALNETQDTLYAEDQAAAFALGFRAGVRLLLEALREPG